MGSSQRIEYWCVPKSNFGGSPDPQWGEALINPEHMIVSQDSIYVDHEAYFIVDKLIPRGSLGRNVQVFKLLRPL